MTTRWSSAARYSASIVRAWPSASSRPSSGCGLAADRRRQVLGLEAVGVDGARSRSARYAVARGCSSIAGLRQCHGSSSAQRALVADDLEQVAAGQREAGVEVARGRRPAKRIVAGERDVDAVAAERLLGAHPLGLAGDQAGAAHAVAADVHQGAAVERRAQADVGGSLATNPNAARIIRTRPTAPSAHELGAGGASADCGGT